MPFIDHFKALSHIPTAPYREHWIRDHVEATLAAVPGVEMRRDRWGNVIARLRRGSPQGPPLAFVAHLDHPGFNVASAPDKEGLLPVTFEGHVENSFFPGSAVRLFRAADDPGIPAEIVSMDERTTTEERNRRGLLRPTADPRGAILGMWDVPAFSLENGIITSRAIDDLAGVAMILEIFERLGSDGASTDTIGILTRAEETGLRGATLFCQDERRTPTLPLETCYVSIECSSARTHTPIGDGAILRVGDRTTIFNPAICQALEHASSEAAKRANCRPLRRALMDGGTCEATVFNLFGFTSGAVCLPLGNYHNMNHETRRIEPEYISIVDAEDLTSALTEMCIMNTDGGRELDELRTRFAALAENAALKLNEGAPGSSCV